MRIFKPSAVYALGAVAMSGPMLAATSPAQAQPVGGPPATSAQALSTTGATPTKDRAGSNSYGGQLTEIVVTAQKRSQSINNVGMAITAATGEQLKVAGVTGVAGLTKIDPSFVASNTNYGAPVYSIRGVSYNDFALAATPTVSVYSDEIPYAYPALTKGAPYDLDRVEVLKGPQGTLYGQNSTGGAINYISAKPTRDFAAGLEATYGSYNATNISGFISGPITDTLRARLSFDVDEGGAWQKSATRDDKLGDKDTQKARLLVDWKPSDRLSVAFNFNGWVDHSETQAAQFLALTPQKATFLVDQPQLAATRLPPQNDRVADWEAGTHPKLDEHYGQAAVRADYRLSDNLLFTYLGSLESYTQNDLSEPSGGNIEFSQLQAGRVLSYSQEARLSGDLLDKKIIWLAGLNYDDNKTTENQVQDLIGSTSSYGLVPYLVAAHLPAVPFIGDRNVSKDDAKSTAAFFNVEYHPIDTLSFHAGARYTETDINHGGCTEDLDGYGVAGSDALEKAIQAAKHTGPYAGVVTNGCSTLGPTFSPVYTSQSLNENNVSWRIGADWKPMRGTLAYASISKGYKAGSFPTLAATSSEQLKPVVQESLIAYEVGVKSRFWGNRIEIDGDVFYYDYENKQLEGRIPDPNGVFGALNVLVNIPKSMEDGAELGVKFRPFQNLILSVQGTYLNSEILGNTPGYDGFGVATNFKGDAFPDTPRYALLADAQYNWDLNDAYSAFAGANVRFRSATQSQVGTYTYSAPPFSSPSTVIDSYTLLALRAGILSRNGHWRFEVFGNNVTDAYYWTHAARIGDTTVRYTGMPATYGVTLAYKY